MKQLNTGLIGLGRIGKVHLENLVYRIPAAKVLTVADPDATTHSFATQLGIAEVCKSPLKVIQNPDVEAVIICSPNNTHLEYITAAAYAGKHIFCEKPLEMTIGKIKKIKKAVKKNKVKLQVGFNRRFDANFLSVYNVVKSKKIGKPHLLKITSRDPAPPPISYIKSSGGMFMDMTIHDFDMARFIVGSEVTEVYAVGKALVDKAIEKAGDIDTAVITLKFKNGCIAIIDNSRKAVYGYDQRLEIFGSKGMSQVGNNYPDTQILYNKKGRHTAAPLHFFMQRYTESYCEELRAFIHAVKNKKPVPVDCDDALKATQLALAAKQSIKKGRPVKLK